ncbi:MAG: hypothetical protein A3I66_05480 [Burkholderiales bacterium RIFCSPLOWO2_02_FULL_57_36]|nr:MAG: hypothetical protein A3I66_05480 [Burkholderiales bacterium RIFCSPLOWO2_02_FULL_57_36]
MKAVKLGKAGRECGAVLVVMLVIIGVLTVIVATLVATSNVNFRIAGNQQYRYEAKLAAQHAIEAFISSAANFTSAPPTSSPVGLDLDGDGTNEYTATAVASVCLSTVRVKPAELNVTNAADRACINSQYFGPWIEGILPPESNCQNMVWDVSSTVNDATTGAQVELHQGIAQRAKIDVSCP